MTNDHLLVVSTLADGPYWQSVLEVLSPPSGVSFYRPFSYRSDWVDDSVLERLPEGGQIGPLEAIVGMRFRSRSEDGEPVQNPQFIPLRQAVAVVSRKGDLSVRFVLGDFIQSDKGAKDFHLLQVPQGMNEKDGSTILLRLATTSERQQAATWNTSVEPDYLTWQLLSESTAIPTMVRDRFRDQVVLYATGLRNIDSQSALEARQLPSGSADRLSPHGYELEVGNHYEVDLNVRRVGPSGSPEFPEGRPEFKLINDPSTLKSSAPVIPFTGNYRAMPVWVRPLHRIDAPLDIWWHPQASSRGAGEPTLAGLRIPFVAKRVFPTLQVAVAFVALVLGVFAYVFALAEEDPSATLVAILLSVGTLLVSVGTSQAVDATRRWDDQG